MKRLLLIPAFCIMVFLAGCSEYSKSYSDGRALYQKEQYADAIRKYRLAISQGMEDPVVYADLALALERFGEKADAKSAVETALEKGPDSPEVLKKAGLFYLMRAQDATALDLLKKSLTSEEEKLSEADLETMGYIADIYRRAGVYQEAVRIYNLLITQGYCTLEHEILAGQCYLNISQNMAACQYFEMAAANKRVTPKHYAAMVLMLDEAGDAVDAERFYEAGLKLIAESGGMSEGAFAWSCGRMKDADTYLAESDDEETVLIRAEELRKRGLYEEAERLFENLIMRGGDGGNVYNAYLMLKTEEGDYTAAKQLLTKVLSSDDVFVRADGEWNEIMLLERMQDYDGALEKLRAYASRHYLNETERKELRFLSGGARE